MRTPKMLLCGNSEISRSSRWLNDEPSWTSVHFSWIKKPQHLITYSLVTVVFDGQKMTQTCGQTGFVWFCCVNFVEVPIFKRRRVPMACLAPASAAAGEKIGQPKAGLQRWVLSTGQDMLRPDKTSSRMFKNVQECSRCFWQSYDQSPNVYCSMWKIPFEIKYKTF